MSEELMMSFKEHHLKYGERNSYMKKMICDILGYDENHMYNQMLEELCDGYLVERFLPVAIEEFQISGMIEAKVNNMSEEKRTSLATNIVDGFIKPIAILVVSEDLEHASQMFMFMNDFLRKYVIKNTETLAIDKQINELKDYKIKQKTAR